MASKYRPSGSYKDLLNMDASQISNLSDNALRGVVSKLQDAANKRMQHLEQKGLEELSPAYRGRMESGKGKFSLPRNMDRRDLTNALMEARQFLRPESTSSITRTKDYVKTQGELYNKVLGKPIEDPSNYDQRYKNKKVLRKPVKKKISDFWSKYHEWKEIRQRKNPQKPKGGTNEDDVSEFIEEIYEKNLDLKGMEQKATQEYEKEEAQRVEDYGEGNEQLPLTNPKRTRVDAPKPRKHSKSGKDTKSTIKQRFEKIKIL